MHQQTYGRADAAIIYVGGTTVLSVSHFAAKTRLSPSLSGHLRPAPCPKCEMASVVCKSATNCLRAWKGMKVCPTPDPTATDRTHSSALARCEEPRKLRPKQESPRPLSLSRTDSPPRPSHPGGLHDSCPLSFDPPLYPGPLSGPPPLISARGWGRKIEESGAVALRQRPR